MKFVLTFAALFFASCGTEETISYETTPKTTFEQAKNSQQKPVEVLVENTNININDSCFLLEGSLACTGLETPHTVHSNMCTVYEEENGVTVECPDGSKYTVHHGENGSDGKDGADGQDGKSCSVKEKNDGSLIVCEDGTQTFVADGENGRSCKVEDHPQGAVITCGDSQQIIADGKDGEDGVDGQDGKNGEDGADGEDAVILTKATVSKNKCVKIYNGIWAENVQNGKVFDVYSNDKCSDSKGEFCDNVVPSDDSTGKVEQYRGSGTVCWAGNIMISGVKKDNKDIEVYILDFN